MGSRQEGWDGAGRSRLPRMDLRGTQHLPRTRPAPHFSGLAKICVAPEIVLVRRLRRWKPFQKISGRNGGIARVWQGPRRERDSLTRRKDLETTDSRHLWFSAVAAAAAAVAAVVKEEEEPSGRWYQGLTMDEEYDVIVLGTGLTVSVTLGTHSPVACLSHPPR